VLPGNDRDGANEYIGGLIATGIGAARNTLVVRARFCVVAIGNSFGTLSEVALASRLARR